ncbi:hypothetical protein DENSPDRAFT_109343 [Dentipellis sp. KUC8613]|nr:hypothetical protein DENSPDRAFT_109343 [Dentipellis sp. KUC8613]
MNLGRSLLAAYFEDGILIWSLSSRTVTRVIMPVHRRIGHATLSSNEKLVAVSNLCSGFDVYRLSDGIHLLHFPTAITHNCILPVMFIHNDSVLLCGSSCGFVALYSINGKKLLQVLHHLGGPIISALAYHKNACQFIATGTAEMNEQTAVKVWKMSTIATSNDQVRFRFFLYHFTL